MGSLSLMCLIRAIIVFQVGYAANSAALNQDIINTMQFEKDIRDGKTISPDSQTVQEPTPDGTLMQDVPHGLSAYARGRRAMWIGWPDFRNDIEKQIKEDEEPWWMGNEDTITEENGYVWTPPAPAPPKPKNPAEVRPASGNPVVQQYAVQDYATYGLVDANANGLYADLQYSSTENFTFLWGFISII